MSGASRGSPKGLNPRGVIDLLNEYFDPMISAAFEAGGILDNLIGDGMMLGFGPCDGRHAGTPADQAVNAATGLLHQLQVINGKRSFAGQEPLSVGIGVHAGQVVVGEIGSSRRKDFTVLGNAVNTASRIEGMTREHGVPLLLSEQFVADFSGTLRRDQLWRLGSVAVRRKQPAVTIYKVAEVGERFAANSP